MTRHDAKAVAIVIADQWLTIAEYAKHQGVDRGTLSRRAQAVGICLATEVWRLRVQTVIDRKARHPRVSLTQLALEYGFSSQEHFFKMRRRLQLRGIPCTPTEPHP